jgi:predicted GTPase
MRRVLIMGAGGRDFHDFNVVYRDDPTTRVVGFTAAQIPGIADRVYPPLLAGPAYPDGIRVHDEADLAAVIEAEEVDEVVLAYSDLSHVEVMHRASRVLAAGAGFRLHDPTATMLAARRPVVAVGAVRTGCGKSSTSRAICRLIAGAGLSPHLVRHPMPYGDLEAARVQRFADQADIDAARPTVEEREEYELPVAEGITVWAGVDYGAVLEGVEAEADVIVWDGGNNDLPFFAPDLFIVVADALRPGHETGYHPGETALLMADAVVVNKVDGAEPDAVAAVLASVERLNPGATVIRAASPVTLDDGPSLAGARVLCVEDGPTSTHGGLASGAAVVAARTAGAELVDGRAVAVGRIAEAYRRHPHLTRAVPALGYSPEEVRDLAATLDRADCDAVVSATPFALDRLVEIRHPIRRVSYGIEEVGSPTLADVLAPYLDAWAG